MSVQSPDLTVAGEQYEANLRARALEAEDDRAELLQRRLLLTVVVVATASALWYLVTSLEWIWTTLSWQLHTTVMQAGVP
jgi:hypothetical protein